MCQKSLRNTFSRRPILVPAQKEVHSSLQQTVPLPSQPRTEPQNTTTEPLPFQQQMGRLLPHEQPMPLPPQCSTLYDLLTGGYKKLEETHLDIQISDLNQANLARGQECVFLEFGESSALAYLKPIYGENMAEASFQLDTTMIEAATFPALSRPPTPGQVVSAPRSFNSYVKYIRSEKIKIRTGYISKK